MEATESGLAEGDYTIMLAERITSYMTDYNYTDTSVQKSEEPGFAGCIEYKSIISQLIQEAKVNKKELAVVWFDLVNTITPY